jgi:hypothetical protein
VFWAAFTVQPAKKVYHASDFGAERLEKAQKGTARQPNIDTTAR